MVRYCAMLSNRGPEGKKNGVASQEMPDKQAQCVLSAMSRSDQYEGDLLYWIRQVHFLGE